MLLAVVTVLFGCTERVETTPDAGTAFDALPRVCASLTPEQSFSAPVGECCDETAAPLCGRGAGICVAGSCQKQCGARQPLCANGVTPTWGTWPNGSALCYCAQ